MKQKITSCLLGMGLLAAAGLVYSADRFSYSTDGSEVTDNTTGLIWKRCAEGMTWSGEACTDSASTYSHQAALQLAQTQTGWRLPNVKELSSVVDRSFTNPAIDPTAFPNTPPGLFWTSSPYVGGSDNAWFVNFVNGAGKYNSRDDLNYVRLVLVRTSDGAKDTASDAHTVKVGNSLSASNTPNAWDEFTLTLSKVWSNVKSVVYTYSVSALDKADGITDKVINLVNSAWESLTTAFKTSGPKTIYAKFFNGLDGKGTEVDSTSIYLNVGAANVTQTATIADVKDGNTSIADNGTTTNTKPTISGTISPALGKYYKVNLYDGSSVLAGTMTYGSLRTSWTFTPDTAFSAGSHSLTAKVATFDGGATGSAIGNRTFTIPILRSLTDTGITATQCYGVGNNTLVSCTSTEATSLNNQQDGMVGRDVSNSDNTDGKLGFSYSLVPRADGGTYDKTECVKDNITGLMWEGKPASGTKRGSPALAPNAQYTNFAMGYYTNTNDDCDSSVEVTQEQVDASNNAQGYVNAVNAAGLCGQNDWRLPTRSELMNLVDYGAAASRGPAIDADWFPNTVKNGYWTSSPSVDDSSSAWNVNFNNGKVLNNDRYVSVYVRLVR